jgi:hypothetical protein
LYACTILRAEPGRRLAKLYRDAEKPPDDYDAGAFFTATDVRARTFDQFVHILSRLPPDQCLIRGGIRDEALEDVTQGLRVRRLEYARDANDARGECPAAFEPVPRNWVVLDLDKSAVKCDPRDPRAAVDEWRKTLPAELRAAQAAWFPSASAHRSPTLRGKLLVALREPVTNEQAAALARACGCDDSVCRTIQPNYLARPVFAPGARDPLAHAREPVTFAGRPAVVPAVALAAVPAPPSALGARDAAPSDLPPLSARAAALADVLVDRWADGGRVEGHAWLHLAGWLLGRGWTKGEIGSMLSLLDTVEPDARKRSEHWHILGNARAIDGPGGAREWLGEDFEAINAQVNYNACTDAWAKRVEARAAARQREFQSVSERAEERAQANANDWATFESFAAPEREVEYYCEGLRLAPSRGKISVIAGNAGGGKGPIANHLAVCFALGLKAFGEHECERKRVLLIDIEGALLTQRRLRRMARALGHDPATLEGRILHKDASAIGDLTSPDNQEAIADVVKRFDVGVVIVDSYTTAMLASGIDANTPQYAILAQLLGQLGVLAICVGHANKASAKGGEPSLSDLAYSQAFGALAQTALVVHYPDAGDKSRIRIGCARAPETGFAPFDVRFEDTDNDGLAVTVCHEPVVQGASEGVRRMRDRIADTGTNADRVVELLRTVDTLGAGMSAAKIRNALGMSMKQYAAARDEARRRGDVEECALPSDRAVMLRAVVMRE